MKQVHHLCKYTNNKEKEKEKEEEEEAGIFKNSKVAALKRS